MMKSVRAGEYAAPPAQGPAIIEIWRVNENDNWGASLAPTFGAVGAFGLTAGSKDAALLVTLQPGGYTVQVSGADGGTGEAIVEIYEVTP